MGCILNAIEESAYDDYCAECKAANKEPEDWYTFRGHARQYINEQDQKRHKQSNETM